MNEETKKHLLKIINYLLQDEKKNWEECNRPQNHIFTNIQAVNQWLADHKNTIVPKIENFTSPRGGKEVPNQFYIFTDDGVFFQSYKSLIAFKPRGSTEKIKLDRTYWDYSTTTGKYRNEFLGEDKKETQKKITAGVYELVDLNEGK